MIEFRGPNGTLYIQAETVAAIDEGPHLAFGGDFAPASMIFSKIGTAFVVAGTAAEVRDRVRAALGGTQYRPDLDPIADQAAAILSAAAGTFQARNAEWATAAFAGDPSDLPERVARFGEEALELQQALGQSREDAHALVDYVFDRPTGEPAQEMGGTMTTLALLAGVAGLDMVACGEAELARCSTPAILAKIQGKRANRAGRGPLPGTERGAALLPYAGAASRSASHTKAFDLGADEALRALADHLGVTAWAWVNESGSFTGDIALTIEGILAAAGPQAPAASAVDEVDPFPAGADAEPVQLTPRRCLLVTAIRALADALQDEIESSLGRELRSRDLPREWHEAQRLLGDAPNTDQGAEETPKERRQRLRRALSGPTKPSV